MRSNTHRRARGQAGEQKREARTSLAGESRTSLYDEVTATIIAQLEAGRFPWVQPWGTDGHAATGLPRNAATGRAYSGVNILLLWGAAITGGHAGQGWLTFKQALAAGGCVRKGERGTTVVYADRFTPEAERQRARDTGDAAKAVPFLKRFIVFNLDQCEGLDRLTPEPAPLPEREIVPRAEALMQATAADIRIGGSKAFYVPSQDYVQVPPQPAFRAQIDYYRTCFHELSHWTGHPTRLARDLKGAFGSKDYGREELVAEMGAAFVCAALNIVPTVRHADYLGAWLDLLREDNRAIFRAASRASKAADFLLSSGERPEADAAANQPERIAA